MAQSRPAAEHHGSLCEDTRAGPGQTGHVGLERQARRQRGSDFRPPCQSRKSKKSQLCCPAVDQDPLAWDRGPDLRQWGTWAQYAKKRLLFPHSCEIHRGSKISIHADVYDVYEQSVCLVTCCAATFRWTMDSTSEAHTTQPRLCRLQHLGQYKHTPRSPHNDKDLVTHFLDHVPITKQHMTVSTRARTHTHIINAVKIITH